MADSGKQDEAQAPSIKLTRAYKSVFGTEGKRSAAQKLVWEDMIRRWRVNQASFVANTRTVFDVSSKTMENMVTYDPVKAAITDGAKLPFYQIQAFVLFKEKPATSKPKVKK